MKTNMHSIDRILRIFISAAIVYLYLIGYLTGTVALVALAAAVIFALTGMLGFCPLYTLFGFSKRTNKS
ncbi:MAG: YgaP family membrane protein [Fluviicola sp.]